MVLILLCDLPAAPILPLTGFCLFAWAALAKLKPPFWLRKHIDILPHGGAFDGSDVASSPDKGDRATAAGHLVKQTLGVRQGSRRRGKGLPKPAAFRRNPQLPSSHFKGADAFCSSALQESSCGG